MALTLADYRNLVDHALHGAAPNAVFTDANTTRDQIINDAGRYMTFSHAWNYRKRPPTTLTLVQDQEFVALPTDFGEILSLVGADSQVVEVFMASAAEVEMFRSSSVNQTGHSYVVYLVQPTQTSSTALMGDPRLEIYPPATGGDTFELNYYAGWTVLSDAGDVPNIPPQLEPLLQRYVSAFSRDQDDNDFSAIINIDTSPFTQSIKDAQSRRQWEFGMGIGGYMGPRITSNNFEASASPADPT